MKKIFKFRFAGLSQGTIGRDTGASGVAFLRRSPSTTEIGGKAIIKSMKGAYPDVNIAKAVFHTEKTGNFLSRKENGLSRSVTFTAFCCRSAGF
jgi:hypothetical protein